MITIVLTYRNRELRIVKNCLNSLKAQTNTNFKVILVDYGSNPELAEGIKEVANQYDFITLISCPVSGQLWSKCRAINIALKQTETPYFMVGDIDLMFHPNFITIASELASEHVVYFQYGFLSEKESLINQDFEAFDIDFLGGDEVTGTTLFPTKTLKSVNGYDEFYHGWGAEDTDIHIRMKNLGLSLSFYDKEALVKHQWHAKAYRSKDSTTPFHSTLERANSNYMTTTERTKRTKVNLHAEWGKLPEHEAYAKLEQEPNQVLKIAPIDFHITALLSQLKNYENETVRIEITDADKKQKSIQKVKQALKKKYFNYIEMETVNNLLLETIINAYRNIPYNYQFNRQKGEIVLTLVF